MTSLADGRTDGPTDSDFGAETRFAGLAFATTI
jgi:hypothetical protein